jgi:hypothetical protein
MPFIAYLRRGFDHPHENDPFDTLSASLTKARFDGQPGLHALVRNIPFEGNEMNAVLLKPDGFDQTKLTNGVLEPLREADLIQ